MARRTEFPQVGAASSAPFDRRRVAALLRGQRADRGPDDPRLSARHGGTFLGALVWVGPAITELTVTPVPAASFAKPRETASSAGGAVRVDGGYVDSIVP